MTDVEGDPGTTVFILHHVREMPEGGEDVKLIGIYSERDLARTAQLDLSLQPGFAEDPGGFEISEYRLNATHWQDGFLAGDAE